MKVYKREVLVYELEGDFAGFFVEVYKEDDITAFYLYHMNYGIKNFMFGADLCDEDAIRQLIDDNVAQHIDIYVDEHFDE